jgi:hypothetical protein
MPTMKTEGSKHLGWVRIKLNGKLGRYDNNVALEMQMSYVGHLM